MGKFKWKHLIALIGAVAAVIAAYIGGNQNGKQEITNEIRILIGEDSTNTSETPEDIKVAVNNTVNTNKVYEEKIESLETTISELKKGNEAALEVITAEKDSLIDKLESDKSLLETEKAEIQNQYNDLKSTTDSLTAERDSLRALCVSHGIDPSSIGTTTIHINTGTSLTQLTDLEKNRSYHILTGSDAATKDDNGANYQTGISCKDYEENSIEYKLSGKYKYLSGTLFVTAFGAGEYGGNRWDSMSFTIYADNREIFPGDSYAKPSYGKLMPAITITDLSIEGADRIKFVFNNAAYNGSPLICFGNPKVFEN